MALIQDFSLFAGDTRPVDGTAGVNLSGATVRFFMKASMDSTTNLLYKDTNSGITITNAGNGTYTFTLSAVDTANLNGSYYYEVEVVDSLNNVTTVTTGTITVEVGKVSLSYASVDYADSYFDDVLFPEPWTTTTATVKEKALRMATRKIDMQMLIGRKVDLEQVLEFPRAMYSDTKSTRNYNNTLDNNLYLLPGWVTETEVSQAVKDATCEEALALLKSGAGANKRAELQRQGVTSFNLGSLSESYSGGSAGSKLLSPTAAQLLARYIGGGRVIV